MKSGETLEGDPKFFRYTHFGWGFSPNNNTKQNRIENYCYETLENLGESSDSDD